VLSEVKVELIFNMYIFHFTLGIEMNITLVFIIVILSVLFFQHSIRFYLLSERSAEGKVINVCDCEGESWDS
jgi:hypothetical protein